MLILSLCLLLASICISTSNISYVYCVCVTFFTTKWQKRDTLRGSENERERKKRHLCRSIVFDYVHVIHTLQCEILGCLCSVRWRILSRMFFRKLLYEPSVRVISAHIWENGPRICAHTQKPIIIQCYEFYSVYMRVSSFLLCAFFIQFFPSQL